LLLIVFAGDDRGWLRTKLAAWFERGNPRDG
jgi:hypothetical protein